MQKAKRFYRHVATHKTDEGWRILLDDKPVRTPARQILLLPNAALGDLIAAEWAGQAEQINPETMPLTQLAMTAIDRGGAQRAAIIESLVEYAAHDLLSYRVDFPSDFVDLQRRYWDPVCANLVRHHNIHLRLCYDLLGGGQSDETLAQVRHFFGQQDDWVLSALQVMVPALGSVGLAIGCFAGWVSADDAVAAAMLEENWQAEQWGQDAEAAKRQKGIKNEIKSCCLFLCTLKG